MEHIIWNENFSVGVKEIDEQHKHLIHLMNKLIDMKDVSVDSEVISDALDEMTKYADEHFKKEEEYMEEYGYPELETHREQHKDFRKKTVKFCMEAMAYKKSIPVDILEFLRNWWINHILKTDMGYKEFFNARGLK